MGKCKNYNNLVKAAKKWNKSEMEVYNSVSDTVNKILESNPSEDKTITLKSLIAYFEGKSSNSWFTSIMQIAYAVLIGASAIMVSLDLVNEYDAFMVALLLLIAALVILGRSWNISKLIKNKSTYNQSRNKTFQMCRL